MSATNLYINWSGVGFTPTGGSLAPINKVTSVGLNRDGTPEKFKGDLDKFYRAIAVPTLDRGLTIDTGDVYAATQIPIGTVGTVVATLADAINGTTSSGGGFTVTLSHAVCTGNSSAGDHAKYGTARLTFESFAPDGVTDPMAFATL
jgi:hypothetical protein